MLRGKYLKNGVSFLEVSPTFSSSWLWKGLLKNREVVKKGACISITNGANVGVWNSLWVCYGSFYIRLAVLILCIRFIVC